jgi:hypothetical protein
MIKVKFFVEFVVLQKNVFVVMIQKDKKLLMIKISMKFNSNFLMKVKISKQYHIDTKIKI